MELLRKAALFEGASFLLLIFVAVPLKHLAGIATPVMVVGPIHGVAFLFYVRLLAQAMVENDWPRAKMLRMAAAGLIPFGGLFVARSLSRLSRENHA